MKPREYIYEIYVPMRSAETGKSNRKALRPIRSELIQTFGGLTDTRYKNKGIWKVGGLEVHDEVVIWKVLSSLGNAGKYKIHAFKQKLEKLLKQKEILVTETSVRKL